MVKAKTKTFPDLIVTKSGHKYIKDGKHRYRIDDEMSIKEILKNILKILEVVKEQRKQRKYNRRRRKPYSTKTKTDKSTIVADGKPTPSTPEEKLQVKYDQIIADKKLKQLRLEEHKETEKKKIEAPATPVAPPVTPVTPLLIEPPVIKAKKGTWQALDEHGNVKIFTTAQVREIEKAEKKLKEGEARLRHKDKEVDQLKQYAALEKIKFLDLKDRVRNYKPFNTSKKSKTMLLKTIKEKATPQQIENILKYDSIFGEQKLPGPGFNPEGEVEDDVEDVEDVEPQEGNGIDNGLWNTEINKLMKKYAGKGFKGTVALDQIQNLKVKPGESFSFVVNSQPIKIPVGHWRSVFVNKDTIEFFDPFGEEPSKEFYTEIKKILPNGVYQNKINRVKFQDYSTKNCGWFAIKFLTDRYAGKTFKEATGFEAIDKSIKGEKDIEKFKKNTKQFGYVKV
jgi:hypothetical protein